VVTYSKQKAQRTDPTVNGGSVAYELLWARLTGEKLVRTRKDPQRKGRSK